MTTSVYSTSNTNDDIITKALIYKQLNLPLYRIHYFNSNSYMGSVLSKAVLIRFNVQGKGTISQYFVYDINNKIVKYRYSYYSEEQRIKDREKQRIKDKEKQRIKDKEKQMISERESKSIEDKEV
jgi:hypothetical protein